jgi:hypothetical protein
MNNLDGIETSISVIEMDSRTTGTHITDHKID